MSEYKIDDVAKETGLTKRAIRYYEEIGLIPPPERTSGGIRIYNELEIAKLKKLTVAREVLGFSLQELQQYLNINEVIERHRSQYRSMLDGEERKKELVPIAEGLKKEIAMIEDKQRKMEQFKLELQEMLGRVRALLEKRG